MGCKAVVQPELEFTDTIPTSDYPMANSLTEIQKLRDEGVGTDVTFEAEGQQKQAHKIFLMVVSDYCKTQFTGEWGRQSHQQKTISLDFDFKSLCTMIDYAYTGVFQKPNITASTSTETIADTLDELLDLLNTTNYWLMTRLHDEVDAYLSSSQRRRFFVRAENVSAVMDRAETARAERLVQWCKLFKAGNADIVRLLE